MAAEGLFQEHEGSYSIRNEKRGRSAAVTSVSGVIAIDGQVGGKDAENARNSVMPAALLSDAGCRSCLLSHSSCSGCGCSWGLSSCCGSCSLHCCCSSCGCGSTGGWSSSCSGWGSG